MEDLMNEIDRIIEARIDSYKLDLLKNTFDFSLSIYSLEGWIKCEVSFVNVTTALFVNDIQKRRKVVYEYEEGDCLEFTDIHILRGKNFINIDSEIEGYWIKQFSCEGNVAIEIWELLLILEATGIIIDGVHYDLPVN
jgi:hypothetical protein